MIEWYKFKWKISNENTFYYTSNRILAWTDGDTIQILVIKTAHDGNNYLLTYEREYVKWIKVYAPTAIYVMNVCFNRTIFKEKVLV